MDEDTFSDRHGFSPESAPITIRQDAPDDLRGLIPQFAYESGLRPPSALRSVVCRVTMTAPNQNNSTEFPNVDGEVHDLLLYRCQWFEVYDVIEAIADELQKRGDRYWNNEDDSAAKFASKINRLFSKHGIGWQLIGGRVEVRGEEVFETATRPVIAELEEAGLETTAGEIHEALRDLSRRPDPDVTGAIQHAMAAAECISREVSGDKRTLGKVIKAQPELFPPAFSEALSKLFGFTSERGRHLLEGRNPAFEEAELVVTVAAASVTYLKRKLEKKTENNE